MQHLEVSCAVRRFFKSLGFKGLKQLPHNLVAIKIRVGLFAKLRYQLLISSNTNVNDRFINFIFMA